MYTGEQMFGIFVLGFIIGGLIVGVAVFLIYRNNRELFDKEFNRLKTQYETQEREFRALKEEVGIAKAVETKMKEYATTLQK